MKIRLEYMAMLHVKGPASGGIVELPEGATIAVLLQNLEIPGGHQRIVTAFINNIKVSHSCVLAEGDEVFLSIPVGGG